MSPKPMVRKIGNQNKEKYRFIAGNYETQRHHVLSDYIKELPRTLHVAKWDKAEIVDILAPLRLTTILHPCLLVITQ